MHSINTIVIIIILTWYAQMTEPLEQFRQTHLREYYVINGPISELVEYPLDYMARSAK